MSVNKSLFVYVLALLIMLFTLSEPVWAKKYTVSGDSMLPTLKPGDKVKLLVRPPEQIKRGALVAIKFSSRKRKMVKRLIAIAGDRVEIIQGQIKLNGTWLDTSWWPASRRLEKRRYKLLAIQLSRYNHIIPTGSVVVMGDNIKRSFDSGKYGLVSVKQILGEIKLI